jgi:hypothetical protein
MMESEEHSPKSKKVRSKGWAKRSKRSRARIGPKRKYEQTPVQPEDEHTSHWSESLQSPEAWVTVFSEEESRFCHIFRQNTKGCSPLVINRSLIIKKDDNSWLLHVNGHHVKPDQVESLAEYPVNLDSSSASNLLQTVLNLNICVGNPEPQFVELGMSKKHHQFLSVEKEVIALC